MLTTTEGFKSDQAWSKEVMTQVDVDQQKQSVQNDAKASHEVKAAQHAKKKRQYICISDEKREQLIKLLQKMPCMAAARILDIPYDNAKVIKRVWQKTNRIK